MPVQFSPNDSIAVRVKKLAQLVSDVAIGTTWAGLTGKPTTFPPIIGSGAADAVAGNDARLTDARTPTAHTQAASTISDATATGIAVITAVDAAAARTAIGAGTSSFNGAYGSLSGLPTLGTAAATDASAYATAAQGALAAAAQPGDAQLTDLAGLSYAGNSLKVVRVNVGETSFELATAAGGGAWGSITGTLSSQTDLQSALDAKQATLVSATNIKTINGSTVLGSGNLVVTGSGAAGTTVEVNVGTPKFAGKFTITDASITATSKVLCWQAPGPYTGKGTRADEAEMQPVQVIAVEPATGTAVVKWQTPPMIAMSRQLNNGRVGAVGATFDRLINQREPAVFIPTRLGKVRGNIKFTYAIFS